MDDHRRKFLQTISVSGIASLLPFTHLLARDIFDGNNDQGLVINPSEQETFFIASRQSPVTIMIDKKQRGVNSVSLCKEDIGQNDAIPVHKHLNEVEIILIQKGSGIFTLGDKEYEVKEGSAAYIPKGIWHGLRNSQTETLTMLFSYTPSGFEEYFREIGVPKGVQWKDKTPEEFDAIDKKYGIVYKRSSK